MPPQAATPFTWPLVRSHSSSMLEAPDVTNSTLPESSASVAAPPELNVTHDTLTSPSPSALACFSISLPVSIRIIGR